MYEKLELIGREIAIKDYKREYKFEIHEFNVLKFCLDV